MTPYFDIEAYLAYLGDARAVQNASGSGSGSGGGESRWWMSASDKEKERVKLGQTVLYGEVVTSTQTMLDK